ncbi:MAG: DUF4430 domain-containing protein [Oscillospiraceae bacterium]|nr:DUF4430 domain-containing protein [Oscillospiraceae bacterium]MBR6678551.1 DUF4430 domain-containing protein [Oscillospiraceae bacterium]
MSKKKSVVAALVLVVLVLIALLCWKSFAPEAVAGDKTITVEVVHSDGSSKSFTVHTDSETLGAALTEEGLLVGEDGPYGIFVRAVDGETVDEAKEQWWCFMKDGEMLMTGVDMTMIMDGEQYSAVFTEGYENLYQ